MIAKRTSNGSSSEKGQWKRPGGDLCDSLILRRKIRKILRNHGRFLNAFGTHLNGYVFFTARLGLKRLFSLHNGIFKQF